MAASSNSAPPEPPDTRPTRPTGGSSRGPVRIGARDRSTDRSNSKTISIAIAVHVVAFVAFLRLVSLGHGFSDWFGFIPPYEKLEEHVTYVVPPKPKAEKPTPKPLEKPKPTPAKPQVSTGPVVGAPTPVAPVVPQTAVGTGGIGDSSGRGPVRKTGVNPALVGIVPDFTDPRVWVPGPAGINVPRSRQEQLDSVVAYAITSAADSLDSIARIYAPGKPAGDWTKRLKNGDKWGWDQTGLRLGKVTVPNALLALLPAGLQQRMSGNPLAMASAQRLLMSRADIDRFQRVSMNEADFRKEIKELRAKKEREHSDQQAKKKAAAQVLPP